MLAGSGTVVAARAAPAASVATEKAVALCRFAIAQLDLYSVGHEQLRAVWMELMDAAGRRAIRLEALAEVREFLKVHWKKPAAKAPRFSFKSR